MKNVDLALLRSQLESKLAQTPGEIHSIRVLAHVCRVEPYTIKYNLEWLRTNRGMRIEKVANGIIKFVGYAERANDEVASIRGRIVPIIGQCDNCDNLFVIDGHTRFCSRTCRLSYPSLTPIQKETLIASKIAKTWGAESPKSQAGPLLTVAERPTDETFKNANEELMRLVRRNEKELGTAPIPETLDDMDPELEGDIDPMSDEIYKDMARDFVEDSKK